MIEKSFGVIPLKKREEGGWQVLLVRHGKGHWAFPKGHAEKGEEPLQTALRELKEETGLEVVHVLPFEPLQEHYFFTLEHQKVSKTVLYFLAEVRGEVILQEEEVTDHAWLSLEESEQKMTFSEGKRLCRKLLEQLS